MIIDNHIALQKFENNIHRYYVNYSDLKAVMKGDYCERKYFSENIDEFNKERYTVYSEYEEEIVVEIICDNESIIEETFNYAKTKSKKVFILTNKTLWEKMCNIYSLSEANTEYQHAGIYGSLKYAPIDNSVISASNIAITPITQEGISEISKLPPKEWANLPVLIKFFRGGNDGLIIAKSEQELLGYLSYTSSYSGYFDIVNVFVHSSRRKEGIGKRLMKYWINEMLSKKQVPYYGTAKTKESALLAEALGVEKLGEAKLTYQLNNFD